MASVLVIHHDSTIRAILEALVRRQHTVETAKHLEAGVKQLRKKVPELVVVGQDAQLKEGERLLRYLKENNIKLPVVVVVSRGGAVFHQMMLKLGARGFLEYPVEQERFNDLLRKALAPAVEDSGQPGSGPPPLTPEELSGNLSFLESHLNARMKCFAGKNQVYIQSVIGGGSLRTKPRIALKCALRGEQGLPRDVYFEFIRDVCCGDPTRCEAVRRFNVTRQSG